MRLPTATLVPGGDGTHRPSPICAPCAVPLGYSRVRGVGARTGAGGPTRPEKDRSQTQAVGDVNGPNGADQLPRRSSSSLAGHSCPRPGGGPHRGPVPGQGPVSASSQPVRGDGSDRGDAG